MVRSPPANAGDASSIPGLGRSPGEGNGNPLQDSCLGNPMDRGAWRAAVHGVAKSQKWLSKSTTTINETTCSWSKQTCDYYPYWKFCSSAISTLNLMWEILWGRLTVPSLKACKSLCLQGTVSVDCPPIWKKPGLGLALPPGAGGTPKPLSGADDFWTRRKQPRDVHTDFCAVVSFLAICSLRGTVFKGGAVREGPDSSLQFLKNLPTDRVVRWPNFPGKGYPIGQSANSRFWCTVKKRGQQIEKAAGAESCPLRRR